ncbi:helix-turn-helix domain-containing protein [Embleya sp. NPDC020886]|uniref:helix-turn-helix domain-containing protein n=1 Tax=Embleya sp. NPDC020886 TaxID=3363980 RepID=UPI0037B24FBB
MPDEPAPTPAPDAPSPVAADTPNTADAAAGSAIARVVATNLRARRTDRGMTLVELAERSGVSRRMLSLIEKAEGNPSLGTVERIARALGISFAAIIGADPGSAPHPVAPEAMVTPWRSASGHGRIAVTGEGPAAVELWDWLLAPGDHYTAVPDPAGARELILVVSGELTLTHDGTTHLLPEGHAIRIPSDRPYAYANHTTRPVRFTRNTLPPPL